MAPKRRAIVPGLCLVPCQSALSVGALFCLFGITIQERAVSNIMSKKLNRAPIFIVNGRALPLPFLGRNTCVLHKEEEAPGAVTKPKMGEGLRIGNSGLGNDNKGQNMFVHRNRHKIPWGKNSHSLWTVFLPYLLIATPKARVSQVTIKST